MPAPKRPRKLAAEELFEYAVKCLAARIYSTGDLSAKLRLRAAHLPDVAHTIERLNEIGYLNDRHFAETFAAARVANDGFGKIRVLNDLRKHRIAAELAEGAVNQAIDGRSEAELIDEYIERRMSNQTLENERKLASAFRRLRRAGFTTAPILHALKQRAAHPEALDDFPEEEPEEE
ncbi:MAG TPA: RecX family transcriptional regulator [Bryobacteraceae bacterium]|jgi:regulatory protein|nr:RecX family transcriptional regulator [Bryobacteraceae bacterium]